MAKLTATALCAILVVPVLLLSGCGPNATNEENRQVLAQQQAQLDQLKQQVAALQVQHSYSSVAPAPGGCDTNVMHEATRKGGERFAAGDFPHALGYYQDALTACPASAQAQLNVARSYEAIGDRVEAVTHYRLAAGAAGGGAEADAVRQAREAIARLGG